MVSLSKLPTSRLLSIMGGVSVVAHVAFFIVAINAGSCGNADRFPDEAIIKTRLVKLGKKRDEKLLPRIDKAPTPPKPEPVKVDAPTPPPKPEVKKAEPEAKPEPKKSASDVLSKFRDENTTRDLTKLIEDKVGKPIDEGHEEGSEIGTEITGRMKVEYNDRIMAKIHDALSVPTTISDKERIILRARLGIAIDGDGALLDATISSSSKNASFDNAVLAAAKKAAPFPPPPIAVRAFYRNGVAMNVCPVTCR